MYIKSITLDGFKSYAQRTEVNGFDPLFNAITGLNGSGKSNILDSICFVLGISNLSQVRATNLQELVYKNGQAGVLKASVSVVFDNSDKQQSPLGYEQYDELTITRQVVVGGRNKYLINGTNANNTRVQDLFRSVQLNVNNPHFLIMQGRITKVLNMKPPEILSMIEEAAGTRLYETKKENAQKTIEKKDMKLKEIDTILKEEITPTLSKLKDERSSYLEYQKVIRELEHLNKLYIAYQFICAEETKQQSAEELVQMQEGIKKMKDRNTEIEDNIADLSKVIDELERKKSQEEGDTLGKLEKALKDQQKVEALSQSALDNKKETLKTEVKKKKDLTKQQSGDAATLKSKQGDLDKIAGSFEKLEDQCRDDAKALEDAQRHLHAVSAGLSTNQDGEDASLNDQLIAAKNDISNADTETKQAQMRLKHAQSELKKKQADIKKTEQGYKKDEQVHDAIKKNMDKIQGEMSKLGYEDGKEERLNGEKRKLQQEIRSLQDKTEAVYARYPYLRFEYTNPDQNFDRRKVYGLLSKLLKVKNPQDALALELAAGSTLYNVVVENETVSKTLLKNKCLQRKTTFVPLTQIQARPLNKEIVAHAEKLVGKQNVATMLSLIEFDKKYEKAMCFALGNSFLCEDADSAKKVTYDKKILKKSVTREGDVYSASGTLTGGSRPTSTPVLMKIQDLIKAEFELYERQDRLNEIETELNNLQKTVEQYQKLKQQFDLKVHEAELVQARMQQSTHGVQLEEISTLKNTIDEQEPILKAAQDTLKKATEKVKDLEYKMKNAKAIREKELKEAETNLQKSKKKAEQSNKNMKEKQQDVESLKLEIAELDKDLKNYDEQLASVQEAIQGLESQIEELKESHTATKEEVKEAQTELNKQKDLLKACSKEINQKITQQRELGNEIKDNTLKLQELEHKVTKHNKDTKDAAKMVENMLQKYEWIADEKKYFGQANTAYDFKANDPKEAGRRLQKLQETKEKLSKNVNMRAMNMLGKAEEQYADLMKKRKIVLNDKAKIAAVIAELDEKKNEALKTAYEKVNKDFGSIFSTLLPGTHAKLAPPEGQSVLDGLEVKVAFGDVWKESLSELSGGQRSLVALSLILAMLLFKPAPIYILDEVDAALDLSHTQNIGQMLKSHFRHSQFIVVSLKDGMFNNANVLFKTKFVDGVSTVTRYVQHQSRTDSTSSKGAGKTAKQKTATNKRARLETTQQIQNVEY